MHADHNQLTLLKSVIGGSVIFGNFECFYNMDENLGQGMTGVVKKYQSILDSLFYAVKIVDKKKNIDSKDGRV
jgi:hypothetical protein